MAIFSHFLLFLVSVGIIWFFAGLLVESVNNVARRFNQSGFTVAFFVLGFLTSISEFSVMVNATLNGTPEVSAGNLVGASIVILLFILPVMAIVGRGIELQNTLRKRNLAVALFIIALPSALLLDGNLTLSEGLVCLMLYATLAYFIRSQPRRSVPVVLEAVEEELIDKRRATAVDIIKIVVGAGFIFLAGHMLVEEAVYFAQILSVPLAIVGLLALSIGTNVPELLIAVRSILKKHKDIAFGDYLGSAVTNTFIIGLLPMLNGRFQVEPSEFVYASGLMLIGFVAFYIFAQSRKKISRREGWLLVSVYGFFLVIQIWNAARLSQMGS